MGTSILAGIGIGIGPVFLIWVAFDIPLGLVLVTMPAALRGFLSSTIGGTLLAPFAALVVTLIYYRLSEAHAGAVPAPPARGGLAEPRRPRPRTTAALPQARRAATPPGLRLGGIAGSAVPGPGRTLRPARWQA